jgi:hypothetical protein
MRVGVGVSVGESFPGIAPSSCPCPRYILPQLPSFPPCSRSYPRNWTRRSALHSPRCLADNSNPCSPVARRTAEHISSQIVLFALMVLFQVTFVIDFGVASLAQKLLLGLPNSRSRSSKVRLAPHFFVNLPAEPSTSISGQNWPHTNGACLPQSTRCTRVSLLSSCLAASQR